MPEPWKDPIVEEIRGFRRQIEKDFGDNPKRYFDYIRKKQAEHPERYIALQPRRIEKGAA